MYCTCKDCKKQKKRGKVLGSRHMGFWMQNAYGEYEHYYGPVSVYVPIRKKKKQKKTARKKIVHFDEING